MLSKWLSDRHAQQAAELAASESVIPALDAGLRAVRQRCRNFVTRRALWLAGVSALPMFGVDIAVDIYLLSGLIEDINAEFGLTSEQIDRLHPERKVAIYSIIVGPGNTLVGRIIKRELSLKILLHSGVRMASKNAIRLVPTASQMMSAAIGYSAFRAIGISMPVPKSLNNS